MIRTTAALTGLLLIITWTNAAGSGGKECPEPYGKVVSEIGDCSCTVLYSGGAQFHLMLSSAVVIGEDANSGNASLKH